MSDLLTPLPRLMQLKPEPSINIHKQRLISAVIKNPAMGQHLGSQAQFMMRCCRGVCGFGGGCVGVGGIGCILPFLVM